MPCKYTLKSDGRVLDDVSFDALLKDLLQEDSLKKRGLKLEEFMRNVTLFSVNPRADAIAKVEAIKSSIGTVLKREVGVSFDENGAEPDADMKLHDVTGYIGVTSFMGKHGNKKNPEHAIVTPFNEDSWEIFKRNQLRLSGITDESEINRIIKNTKDSWKRLQEIGDAVHAVYEQIFKGNPAPGKPSALNDILSDEIYQQVIDQAQQFKESLIIEYGDGDPSKVSFYPELSIESKEIDNDLKAILSNEGYHHLAGTIDLLVIDSNGDPHIFDYKTSRKQLDPGSWDVTRNSDIADGKWSSTKKLSVQNQLAAYNVMLEQYGLKNATCEVIPIYLDLSYSDDTKSTITGIKDISRKDRELVPKTSNGDIYFNWKSMFPTKLQTTAEDTVDLSSKYQKLMPVDHISSVQVQQFEANVEYYRKQVKEVTSDDTEHYGKYKYYFVKYETTGRREYCKDDEDLTEKLENYVSLVKEKKAREIYALATTLRKALAGTITLDDFVNDYNIRNRDFLYTQFGRYISDGWELVSDDNLVGYGIFIFRKDGRSEVAVVSNSPLHDVYNLGMGTKLLGRFVEDQYLDSKKILPANNGNIEAMKALIYISEHPEVFTDYKITQLYTINPWRGQRTYVLGSQWIDNYNQLVEATKDPEFSPISTNLFWDDVTSLLSVVDSNLKAAENPTKLNGFTLNGQISSDNRVLAFTEEYIMQAINQLRRKYTFLDNAEQAMIGNQNVWIAYDYLNQALLSIKGLGVYSELEVGEWMSTGVKAGLMVASSGYSSSTNFRVFDDVMQQFSLEVRLAVEKQGRPLIVALDAFYKSKNASYKVFGGEGNLFINWFRRDKNGNIDKRFWLKDPNNPDFNGNPAERKALDTWLKTMAELRWRSTSKTDLDFENTVEQAKLSGEYYEVPLTEAGFGKQVKGLGFFKAIKNKFDQYAELTEDVFAGEGKMKREYRTGNGRDKRGHYVLFNKFERDANARAALIEEHGVNFFETNLEEVINQALVAYNKTRLSRKFIPIIDAMRISLRCNAQYGGADMDVTLKSFDKLVQSKFYGESIIEENLQPYARWVQVLKSGLSKLALGFNFRSFFRELFQGTWMGLSRSGAELLPGVDEKTYVEGALHVVKNSYKNFSNISLLQQMNSQYGMANYSMGQISRQRRKNWYGIRNWRSDTLFMTSSAPDFQHRMSILVAKMMGDGCWEAHSLDKDGFIKYDYKKDKRFSIYLSGDTSKKEYIDQKVNYETRIAELNKAGIKKDDGSAYEIGDPLPMAYLPKEIQAIKNFADLLYGHYDDESKSLMNDMFLGSMFLQYKTYITSRVEQWTMTPGIYNTELLQQAVDPITKKKLYKIHTGEVDESGLPIIEIKSEDNIPNFEELQRKGDIEACMEWRGIPMEGMARSFLKFAKDIKNLDWKTLKERWQDPVERDNILIGLHDCLLMSLMLMLVTALFGLMFEGEWTTDTVKVARTARDNGWLSSFTYNIAYGSFQDFPFWQSLQSMFSDLNPSVLISAKRIVENSGKVIMGKESIFKAITNTVGAAADLKGLADNLGD